MSDWMDTLINGLASAAPSALGTILGTDTKTDAASQAAQQAIAGGQDAANILGGGYDLSWGAQNNALGNVAGDQAQAYRLLQQLYPQIPQAVRQGLTDAANSYRTNLIGGITDAANYIAPAAGDYATELRQGAGNFAGTLGDAANRYGAGLTSLAGSLYSPYTAAGRQALTNLQGISAADPNQMTPLQAQARDDYLRQAEGSLAGSGLRGSGRAQGAVIGKGLADLQAQDFAQNQARADAATQALLGAGTLGAGQQFGAGSAALGAGLSATGSGANAILQAVNQGALTLDQARQALGNMAFSADTSGANALLSAQNQSVGAATNAANNLINATNSYMGQKQATDLAQGQIDTTDIMGKANAAAGAAQGAGLTNAAVTAANGANWGGAIGTLGGVISGDLKSQLMPSSYSSGSGTMPIS